MSLQPHQQRVVAERIEMQDRVTKLYNFVHGHTFHSVDIDEQARLRRQLGIMQELESVLAERIQFFIEGAA